MTPVWALVKSMSTERNNTTGYIRKLGHRYTTNRKKNFTESELRASEQYQQSSKFSVFGPTVYVMVDLDGQKHKTLVLLKKAYSQYEQRSKLRPFRERVLSATVDPFEVLGIFTGELTFDTGVKVKADLLVTPNTDVLLILEPR